MEEPSKTSELTDIRATERQTQPQQAFDTPVEVVLPQGEDEARLLLKRTPTSFLLNQAYGLWVFISLFFITIIVTHKLTVAQYGVYAVAMAAFNTIAYIVALGLEDATTTYVPRVFAEHGRAAAASLIRRTLLLRLIILALSLVIILFAIPTLAAIIAIVPIKGSAQVAAGLRDPSLLGHIIPIAFYVLGNGISSLVTAVCASLMRMRIVFVLGGVTQVVLLAFSFVVLQLGLGINGVLWLFALTSLLNALAFLLWLIPLLDGPWSNLYPAAQTSDPAWYLSMAHQSGIGSAAQANPDHSAGLLRRLNCRNWLFQPLGATGPCRQLAAGNGFRWRRRGRIGSRICGAQL